LVGSEPTVPLVTAYSQVHSALLVIVTTPPADVAAPVAESTTANWLIEIM